MCHLLQAKLSSLPNIWKKLVSNWRETISETCMQNLRPPQLRLICTRAIFQKADCPENIQEATFQLSSGLVWQTQYLRVTLKETIKFARGFGRGQQNWCFIVCIQEFLLSSCKDLTIKFGAYSLEACRWQIIQMWNQI